MLIRQRLQSIASHCALIFTLGLSTVTNAQSSSKADFENRITKEFCDSFDKISPRLTNDNMTTEMGVMIIPIMTRYRNDAKNYWNIEMETKEGIHAFGEKVGQLAALNCPSFLTYIKNNLQSLAAKDGQALPQTFSGKIVKIEGQPFAYLLVQNGQGRTDKFYWLEFFEGANQLSEQPAASLNKSVLVSYKEMDVYQASEKEYRKIKILSKIEWKR